MQYNEAKELTSQLLSKFEKIPNSIDLSLPDKRSLDWKFFIDYVKPSRTIEVMKISTDQEVEPNSYLVPFVPKLRIENIAIKTIPRDI